MTIAWNGNSHEFAGWGYTLTIQLEAGQSVTFTYTDRRVIVVEPEPDDSSSEDIDSAESSKESSESTGDWESNYSTREQEQYATAYISNIYVSSLYERNPG